MQSTAEEEKISALKIFLMGLRSPESKRTYPHKLGLFIDDFLKLLPGSTLEEQAEAFVQLAKENGVQWVLHRVLSFRAHYDELIEKGEIEASTVDNYLNVIKSFCDKNEDSMPTLSASKWKMIKSGLPKKRTVANDRAPTEEEIRKLLNYDDPRIKALVLTFVSSGIRAGAWAYKKNGRDWVYLRWGAVERIPKDESVPIVAER